jgi:KUP system potassium uptake protein
VISGAFSITMQASRLGFLPRFRVLHTSDSEKGQVYIPAMNWMMWVAVLILVMEFKSSSNLAAAYGIAVCAAMMIDTALCAFVVTHRASRRAWLLVGLMVFLAVEGLFFAGNLTKFTSGGWLPTLLGLLLFIVLTTWKRGSALVKERQQAYDIPLAGFLEGPLPDVQRVPGQAVYLCTNLALAPTALFHNLKHFKVMHETNVFLHVHTEEVPHVPADKRLSIRDAGHGMFLVSISYGFRRLRQLIDIRFRTTYSVGLLRCA